MAVKRIARWFVFVLAGLVLLAVTSAIVMQTAWFRERLRRIAVERAAEVLNGELTVGQISGSLWTGVTLHHIVLRQTAGPVLSVETIELRYDPRVLLKRHFVFDQLVLTRPVVFVAQRADGWNVAHLVKPSTKGGGAAIQFRRLSIVDGQVNVEPAGEPARHFAHVNADMGLSYSGNQLEMAVQSLDASDSDTGWRIDRGRGNYRGSGVSDLSASIDLETSAGAIALRAEGQPPKDHERSIAGTVDVRQLNLAPVLARRDMPTELTGRAAFRGSLPGEAGGNASISFDVDAPSVTAVGYHADGVRGRGSYGVGILHFDVKAVAYGASGTAKGEWRTPSAHSSPNTWALAGRFRDLDARQVPASLSVPKLATRLAGSYKLNLAPRTWSVSTTLDRSTVEGAQIARGMIVNADNRTGVPRYDARGRVSGLDPQRLAGPLNIPTLRQARFHGRVTGDIHVTGRGRGVNDTVLSAQATLADTTVGPTHVPNGDLTVDLASRRLAVTFSGPFEHVTQETLALDPKTPFDLSGTANGELVIHDVSAPVSIATLEVTGQSTLGRSEVAGYQIDQAVADVTLANGLATVRQFDATGLELNATAKGTVTFDAEGESNLELVVDAVSLDEVAKRIGRPIAGAAHLEAKVTGPSNRLTATGTLTSRDVKYGDTLDALTVNSTFTAEVADQQWRNPKVTAETKSTFLKVGGQEVQQVTAKTVYHDNRVDIETAVDQKDRSVQAAGDLLLHPDHQEAHLQRFAVTTTDVTWTLLEGSEATIQYHPDRVVLKGLTLARGEERISADGTFGIGEGTRGASFQGVDFTMTNVQVADINRILLGRLNLTGTINGQAHVTGTTSSPDVTSKFTVANGSVQGTPYQLLTAKADYRDRRVTLDAALDERPGARLTAVGTVPVSSVDSTDGAGEPMNVQIQSTPIDLGLFQPFVSHVTALKGTGEFNARVTGSLKAPQVNGTAKVADASFTVEPTGVSYLGANADVRFEGQRVGINQFKLQDEHGHTLTAEGGVDVADGRQVRAVDVHVLMDDLDLLHSQLGEIGLDGDLKITGELRKLHIEGDVSVDRGRIELDRVLEQFTSSAYKSEPGPAAAPVIAEPNADAPPPQRAPSASTQETGTLFDNATMNVRLEMPDNVVVRARDLRPGKGSSSLGRTNMTLGGKVTLSKAPREPVSIVGTVEAVRGFYEFQGRRFDVLRDSEVRFRGEQPIDPLLNVSAEREINAVTAQVRVRGTARQPTIQLSSYPPLDEGDILSLIVFGQPMNSLGEAQRINLAERAGMLAAGAIATPLSESIGRALDMDVFEIRAEGAGGAGSTGATLALGRQLGSRLFIGVRQAFGKEEMSAVSFEYRVSPQLRVVTSVGQGTQQTHQTRRTDPTGVDLIFVIRY